MAVMELVVRAIDQASAVLEKVGKTGVESGSFLEKHWLKIGAAAAGAGVAMEALARKQAPLTETTSKLSNILGITNQEVRELAIGMSDVTFPLEDALGLMQTGAQLGLETTESLEKFATFWDMVGDATGLASTQLAKASTSLRQVGIGAGEEAQALEAFGFVTRHTTSDVSDFLTFLERTGPQLTSLGMSANDTAAMFGILEKEVGLTGRTARQYLRTAIREAEGDMDHLFQTLGITAAQFEEYTRQVEASSHVIEENASVHAESYTMMQKLQHAASEMVYKYGDLIQVVGNFSPLLSGLGPAIKAVTSAKTLLATVTSGSYIPAIIGAANATKAFTVALLANPFTLIIAGVMALIAVIVLLVRNWDAVSKALSDGWNWVRGQFDSFVDAMRGLVANLGRVFEGVKDAILAPFRWVEQQLDNIMRGIRSALDFINPFRRHSPSLVDNVRAGVRVIKDEYGTMADEVAGSVASLSRHKQSMESAPSLSLGMQANGAGVLQAFPHSSDSKILDKLDELIRVMRETAVNEQVIPVHIDAVIRDESDLYSLSEKMHEVQRMRRRSL